PRSPRAGPGGTNSSPPRAGPSCARRGTSAPRLLRLALSYGGWPRPRDETWSRPWPGSRRSCRATRSTEAVQMSEYVRPPLTPRIDKQLSLDDIFKSYEDNASGTTADPAIPGPG